MHARCHELRSPTPAPALWVLNGNLPSGPPHTHRNLLHSCFCMLLALCHAIASFVSLWPLAKQGHMSTVQTAQSSGAYNLCPRRYEQHYSRRHAHNLQTKSLRSADLRIARVQLTAHVLLPSCSCSCLRRRLPCTPCSTINQDVRAKGTHAPKQVQTNDTRSQQAPCGFFIKLQSRPFRQQHQQHQQFLAPQLPSTLRLFTTLLDHPPTWSLACQPFFAESLQAWSCHIRPADSQLCR